jgi:hypothetical protein
MHGNRIHASKATDPSKDFVFKDPDIKLLYLVHNTVLILYIFHLYMLKINQLRELRTITSTNDNVQYIKDNITKEILEI